MGLLAQERAVDSKSYLFDGSGGMRDQLEQAILNELEKKKYLLKTKLANVKSGGVIFGTKEQCVVIDCGGNTRIVIANTTVGTYLYVQIYLLIPFSSINGASLANEPINDIFKRQQRDAVFAAAVDSVECAFSELGLKAINRGYRQQ